MKWKSVFWFVYLAFIISIVIFSYFQLYSQLGIVGIIDLLLLIPSVLAIYYLSVMETHFTERFWKIYFIIFITWSLLLNLFILPNVLEIDYGRSGLIIGILIFSPLYVGLYVYSFKFFRGSYEDDEGQETGNKIKTFLNTIKDSSTRPDFYSSKREFSNALKYLTTIFLLIVFLSISQISFSVLFYWDSIPDFQISNGKLSIDSAQPIHVDKNTVIDTTGETIEPVVNEKGEGLLITSEMIILKQGMKESRYEIGDLEQFISNKEDLKEILVPALLILPPIFFVLISIYLYFKFGFWMIVLSGITYVLTRLKKSFKSILVASIFAFTPYILLTYTSWFISNIYIDDIGFLWTLGIFILGVRKLPKKGSKDEQS